MDLALILGCSSPKFEADGGGRGRLAPRPPGPREVSAPQDGPPLESSSEEGERAVQGLGQMALEGWESLLPAGDTGEGTLGRARSRPGFALQASGRRSPESCSKPEKILKRGTYDKVAGLDWAGGGREPCPPPQLDRHERPRLPAGLPVSQGPEPRRVGPAGGDGAGRRPALSAECSLPPGLHRRAGGTAPEADGAAGAQRAATGTGPTPPLCVPPPCPPPLRGPG